MRDFTEVIHKAIQQPSGGGQACLDVCLAWLTIHNALNGISSKSATGGMRHITNEELYAHFEKFKSIVLDNGFATGVTEVNATGVSRTIGVYFKHKQLSQDPDEFCITVIDFREKEIFFGEVGKSPKYVDQYSQLIDRQL